MNEEIQVSYEYDGSFANTRFGMVEGVEHGTVKTYEMVPAPGTRPFRFHAVVVDGPEPGVVAARVVSAGSTPTELPERLGVKVRAEVAETSVRVTVTNQSTSDTDVSYALRVIVEDAGNPALVWLSETWPQVCARPEPPGG